MMTEFEFLRKLLETPSPSGQEEKATEVWKMYNHQNTSSEEFYHDKIGNSAYQVGHGPKKVLISGHIDQVNARVVYIHDNGLLALQYTGGIDNRCLPVSKVYIITDSGDCIEGAVIKQAMHNDKSDEWPESYRDMSQLRVSIGAEKKEAVQDMGIHPGSLVCYKSEVNLSFGKNRICSTSLDDKIGVYIAAEVLRRLEERKDDNDWKEKYTVIGLSTTQEETGLRGATVAAHEINPDISIDTDVTFATDDEMTGSKEKMGDIELGKGFVISWGCDKSTRLNRIIKETAKKHDISFQEESSTAGGTNTEVLQLASKDCETTHIAIPNQSMHTQNEICDWRDIKGAIDVIVNLIIDQSL